MNLRDMDMPSFDGVQKYAPKVGYHRAAENTRVLPSISKITGLLRKA